MIDISKLYAMTACLVKEAFQCLNLTGIKRRLIDTSKNKFSNLANFLMFRFLRICIANFEKSAYISKKKFFYKCFICIKNALSYADSDTLKLFLISVPKSYRKICTIL
jgi:hypothetical protein